MLEERGVVRRIAWREIFPWLVLLRAPRQAFSPTVLLLATLAVFASSFGWRIAPYVFFSSEQREDLFLGRDPGETGELPDPASRLASHIPAAVRKYLPAEPTGVVESFFGLSEPVGRLFSYRLTINEVAYYLFGFLCSLAVWAFAGGFITRRAVVQTAIDDSPGLVETAQFSLRRWPWYFLAPLYPLLGVLILLLMHVPLGWLMRADFGVLIAGIFWFLVLLAGIAGAWLVIGTLLGWPLMWGALSAEREGDAFEAFSRSFSYVYGRPLHYLFYIVIAAILGALGYAAAYVFVRVVLEFGFWAVSWGAGREQVELLRSQMVLMPTGADPPGSMLRAGISLLNFWESVAHAFLQGYTFAYFWSAAGNIYLLLRQDVDEKEMDEVYLPEDEQPVLSPQVASPPATSSSPAAPAEASGHAAPPPTDLAAEE